MVQVVCSFFTTVSMYQTQTSRPEADIKSVFLCMKLTPMFAKVMTEGNDIKPGVRTSKIHLQVLDKNTN